jgi:phosphoglycerate dehydrogenase-like enzyme
MSQNRIKILFCSKQYPETMNFLKSILPSDKFYIFNCNENELKDKIKDVHVAVPLMSKLTEEIINKAHNLKLIHQFGVGLEGVDLEAAKKRGIHVANIPADQTGNAYSVSELTLFLIFALLKNFKKSQESFLNRQIGYPLGDVILGKKFLILGYGNVGKAVVNILKKFPVEIIVARRTIKNNSENNVKFVTFNNLSDILPEIDFLIVAITLNSETKDFVDEKIINKMDKGSFLINVSRGGVVKYKALLHALKNGQIKGAGLDVYWDEPFNPEDELLNYNVITTPHIAGSTNYSYSLMAEYIAKNIERVFIKNLSPID